MNALTIRPACAEDLPDLLALYQHLTPGDAVPSLEQALANLERLRLYPGSDILIGIVDNHLAVSCTLIVVPNLTRGGKPYALIENVVTHADFRRRGFGQQILDAACEAAWTTGCYKTMLMTGSNKPDVLDFYRLAGFEQSKTGFQKRQLPARQG